MEYKIIRGNEPATLGRQVTEALKEGWALHGQLVL